MHARSAARSRRALHAAHPTRNHDNPHSGNSADLEQTLFEDASCSHPATHRTRLTRKGARTLTSSSSSCSCRFCRTRRADSRLAMRLQCGTRPLTTRISDRTQRNMVRPSKARRQADARGAPLDAAPVLLVQPRRVRVALVGDGPAHFLLLLAAAAPAARAPAAALLVLQLVVVHLAVPIGVLGGGPRRARAPPRPARSKCSPCHSTGCSLYSQCRERSGVHAALRCYNGVACAGDLL
jgi:hypothetical protein